MCESSEAREREKKVNAFLQNHAKDRLTNKIYSIKIDNAKIWRGSFQLVNVDDFLKYFWNDLHKINPLFTLSCHFK
jgi:hypothetical protein